MRSRSTVQFGMRFRMRFSPIRGNRKRFAAALSWGVLCVGLLLIPGLLVVSPADAGETQVPVFVRDSYTGAGIPGARLALELPGKARQETAVDESSHTRLSPPPVAGRMVVTAKGYSPLHVRWTPESRLPMTVWLDPAQPVAEVAAKALGANTRLRGFVIDVSQGRPVPGALVQLAEHEAATNESGWFELVVPARPLSEPYDLPEMAELVVQASGFRKLTLTRTLLEAGADRHLLLDLHPGIGTETIRATHKLVDEAAMKCDEVRRLESFRLPETGDRDKGIYVKGIFSPESIRVGTNCECDSCPTVDTMSLETYVARGLDNEWLLSWENPVGDAGRHAFRAGAVAYRSYGAYYVEHPRNGSFDICGSACCQAYDAYSSTQSSNAAHFTHSTVLSQDGVSVFRSEYSSENNSLLGAMDCKNYDLSCGNGYAGSPAYGWPCLADHSSCTGRACFGHGRGMCQYGSSFWARYSSKDYVWILDHYYNNNFNPSGSRSVFIEELTELAVGRNQDGRLDVFGRWSSDNTPRHAAQASAGSSSWTSWSSLSGALLSSPAVAANSDGRLQIVVRGTSHQVWTKSQVSANGSWSDWTKIPGILASSEPAMVRNTNGRLQVFVRGSNYQLYTSMQTSAGGTFGSWYPLEGICTSAPAAGVNADGRVQVFVRGIDDQCYTRWQSSAGSTSWAGWVGVGTGQIASKPAVGRNADGRLEVFARGTGTTTYTAHAWQTTVNGVNSWADWASFSDTATSPVAVVANSDGRLQIFTRGSSGDLRTTSQTVPNGGWNNFSSLSGTCTSAPVAAINADGRVQVFVRGLDRAVYAKVQQSPGGAFSDWIPLSGSL